MIIDFSYRFDLLGADFDAFEKGAEPVVGVDFSGELLRHARRLREWCGVDARFVQGDVTALPLADDRFEVRRLLEHRHREAEETAPIESDLPELLWRVPKTARFRAVAR